MLSGASTRRRLPFSSRRCAINPDLHAVIPHDKVLYRTRHKVENLFARLKDWRRIATLYDRCAHTFMAAVTRAAICIFWINEF